MTDRPHWRRLAVAAALSGAAHAALAVFGRIELPSEPPDLPPLAVRLERVETRREAPPPSPPRTPRVQPPPAAIPVRTETPRPAATLPAPENAGATEPAIAEAPPAPEQPPAPSAPVEAEQPVVVATAPASTLDAEPAALPHFPRRGRISFTLLYGRDGFPVGRTDQSWQIDGTRYQLASRSETTGLVDLIRSQHRTYMSRGELTAQGFRPDTFLMSRNRGRGTEEARAQFDWGAGSITLGPAHAQRAETLQPGTQDLVSFMYQLALDPPAPGRKRVAVTNGTRLEAYELDVGREERIETPLGVLRARRVRQVPTPGEESVEVWLATEYRHLPVRIRFYDRDGEPAGEQVVTEIRLSED